MDGAACDDDTILLLLPDGGVRMFSAARPGDPPLLAADILAEFPACRVCRLDSPSSPGRSACLSPRAALRPGTTYFLVEPVMGRDFCGLDPVTMEPITSFGPCVESAYRPKSAGGAAGQFPDFMETSRGCFPTGAPHGFSHSRNPSTSSSGSSNASSNSSISSNGGSGGCGGSEKSSGPRRLIRGLTSPAAAGGTAPPAHRSQSFRPAASPSDAPEPFDMTAAAAAAVACGGNGASPLSPMTVSSGPYISRAASWSAASAASPSGWADACDAALNYGSAHDFPPARSTLDPPEFPPVRSRHASAEDAAFEFIKQHNATTSSASRRFQRAPLSPAPLPPRCSAQQQQSAREQQSAAAVLGAGASGRLGVQRSSSTRNKIVSLEDIVYGRVTS
ncbi:hypothetical protein CLOM_g9169 [Closterium sp. NIES-68]|nr:hypothetical protein CLOM_g4190 [Closterium sp. NIES-68]GJP50013.1 hypothetical protein CLOM_g9169 [Closterium sp. NIES-68]GJP77571.1 hypothetical protein CLOP_g7941 [Closterium sp. NIES-67]